MVAGAGGIQWPDEPEWRASSNDRGHEPSNPLEAPPVTTDNGARTIVLADDRRETREQTGYWLRQAGFHVVEASDTSELLAHVADRPDVIVLDAQLPGRGAFEIANRLKRGAQTASIPIIHVSSAFTTGEWRAQGLEAGADAFLTHPVEPQELIATVRALLRVRAAEESVRMAAEQCEATFDAITDAVCLIDDAGRLQRCNDAADTLLASVNHGHGDRKFHEIFPPDVTPISYHRPRRRTP